jgi:sodium/bile acid cotransporter 7
VSVILAQIKRSLKDWFLLGMISGVVLASAFPTLGSTGGLLRIDRFADVGIFLIFFFHGLALSPQSLKAGMLRLKLHVAVQVFTFCVFPVLGLVALAAFGRWIPSDLMLGFFYLCALPSTISSSVAMTAIAKGNVPAAIFNATLSSLLGIFATPLIVSLVASTSGQGLSIQDAMLNIAKLLLLPFVVGQLARPVLWRWFKPYEKHINNFDRVVILLLVLQAFSDSVRSGLWTRHGPAMLLLAMTGAGVFLAIVLFLTWRTGRLLGFDTEDEITLVFCGSKKTLASGVPMAKLLFGAHPGLGVIVLPIMFYHQIQLFVCSGLAARYARRFETSAATAPAGTPRRASGA